MEVMDSEIKLEREIKSEYEPSIERKSDGTSSLIDYFNIAVKKEPVSDGDSSVGEYIPINSVIVKQDLNSPNNWAELGGQKSSVGLYDRNTTSTQFEFVSVETKSKQIYDEKRIKTKPTLKIVDEQEKRKRKNEINRAYRARRKELLKKSSLPKVKISNAEKSKAYRARKKLKQLDSQKIVTIEEKINEKRKKTALRVKLYRERQQLIQEELMKINSVPKVKLSNAEKCKAYRARKKLTQIDSQKLVIIDEKINEEKRKTDFKIKLYRERQQLIEEELMKINSAPKIRLSNAEKCKAYRARQKLTQLESQEFTVDRKMNEKRRKTALRNKAYRERQRLKKSKPLQILTAEQEKIINEHKEGEELEVLNRDPFNYIDISNEIHGKEELNNTDNGLEVQIKEEIEEETLNQKDHGLTFKIP